MIVAVVLIAVVVAFFLLYAINPRGAVHGKKRR